MDEIELYRMFLTIHQPQLQYSGVPEIFWETLWSKLRYLFFDSGSVFELAKIEYEQNEKSPTDPSWKLFVTAEKGISSKNGENIFLIDHAWTYSISTARQNLTEVPGLLDRMCNLMGMNSNEEQIDDEKLKFVLSEMWRYNQTYALGSASIIEDRLPIWYIMDEVGSAINHSDDPNFRAVPFLYVPEGATYTLLYPIKDSDMGDEVTRDFIQGQTSDENVKRALLLPWKDDGENFIREDFIQIEPDEDYFLQGHIKENLATILVPPRRGSGIKLRVFSQYELLYKFLDDPAFEMTGSEQGADVLWLTSHFKDYEELSRDHPDVFINQFPFEHVLTVKDLLSIVCRRKAGNIKCDLDSLETYPLWLPTTYNLRTELVKFVAYFKRREAKGLDNHWICKPWNLARGLDIHITNNLNHILRLSSTGPKIAQKYIVNPVLYFRQDFGRVKFDIRYIILLKSVEPLNVYVYSNFFLRFANREFALDNFDNYEQHFTVMNYLDDSVLYHLKCANFISEWKKQYPEFPWNQMVEKNILNMLRDVFEAAAAEKPPRGVGHNPQSRAIYAADIMLEWRDNSMQPSLLEINFIPDCKRACDYYPEFWNDIFRLLFLDIENPDMFHKLFP